MTTDHWILILDPFLLCHSKNHVNPFQSDITLPSRAPSVGARASSFFYICQFFPLVGQSTICLKMFHCSGFDIVLRIVFLLAVLSNSPRQL